MSKSVNTPMLSIWNEYAKQLNYSKYAIYSIIAHIFFKSNKIKYPFSSYYSQQLFERLTCSFAGGSTLSSGYGIPISFHLNTLNV
ncbi:hypothetical protein SAMN05216521_10555 [Enterocloster clostridioformis]|uniref:Uncharacterized protein n=1 Tax=Enterocloster clostridioformis TaxID=1531 RepID=A0A1I0JFH5_9FIRM|nr:hypothetical protein SAMN05216521_10555 [Enterocloster clostridioformis]SEW45437.1 hypothetical protein SAMN05216528_105338 [Enterocloster clostridioformis]